MVWSLRYLVSQNLPQIWTASVLVYRKSIFKQMQYRFAVSFETHNMILHIIEEMPNQLRFNGDSQIWRVIYYRQTYGQSHAKKEQQKTWEKFEENTSLTLWKCVFFVLENMLIIG